MRGVIEWMDSKFYIAILTITIIAVIPFFVLALWLNDIYYQKAAIVVVATLIVHNRLHSAPLLVALQGGLIIIGFLSLFFSLPIIWLFVLLCGGMAACTILLAGLDRTLRTYGNFTFIPALYLACEFNEGFEGDRIQTGFHFVTYMGYALLPVLFLSACAHYRTYNTGTSSLLKHMLQFHHRPKGFSQGIEFVEPVIAIAVAVSLSALLVAKEGVLQGQWLIWSAASVITGESVTVLHKLLNRTIGVLLGVPIGVTIGSLLPNTIFFYDLGTLCTLLTLVAFRNYTTGFGTRCACVAFVITLKGGGVLTASVRILNVLVGGLIGASIFYIIHKITGRVTSYLNHQGR